MTYQYLKDNNKINYNNLTIWNSEIYSGSCHKYNIIAMQIFQGNYLDLVLCLLPDGKFLHGNILQLAQDRVLRLFPCLGFLASQLHSNSITNMNHKNIIFLLSVFSSSSWK